MKMIRSRNRRRYALLSRHSIATEKNNMTMTDCYAAAYYLYCIAEITTTNNEDDLIPHVDLIRLLIKLSERMNKTEELSDLLEQNIKQAEKDEQLIQIDGADSSKGMDMLCFEGSSIPYTYLQDKEVDRELESTSLKVNMITINLYRCILTFAPSFNFFSRLIANVLLRKKGDASFSLLSKIPSHIQKALLNNNNVDFISKALELKEEEALFLEHSYRCTKISLLESIFDLFTLETKNLVLTKILGISDREYSAIIRGNAALRTFGLIDEDANLVPDTIDCIASRNIDVFFEDLVKEADYKQSYNLESFNLNKNASNIMHRMLSGTENISLLLYGKPGSGKTEFAKALAVSSGLRPLIFKNEAELDRSAKNAAGDNVICRLNLLLSINQPGRVLIVDEADSILRTKDQSFFGLIAPSKTKGTVNKMLEKSKNKIIWIVNFTSQIDDSTLRRFNFSYKFDAMSKEQLRAITCSKILPLNLPQPAKSEILSLMEKYSVTGASVDNVIKTVKSLGATDNKELISCVKTILKENELLINGRPKVRSSVTKKYDIHALNANMDPEKIVTMIKNAQNFSDDSGIRMLFYGRSGTGKTEFARFISEQLGKKLLLKRASDIFDKYVGGTEENIRDAFEEAERTDSILLFDEADSFFASRENASHSWERTQVNEFLTQLEEFNGVVICTTNLKQIMDPAMNRRFHMIVEFKPLSSEGICSMLSHYFQDYTFTDEEINRIECASSVTPGDFGVLSNRIRFMDTEEVSSEYITDELCKMQEDKDNGGKRIGFFS